MSSDSDTTFKPAASLLARVNYPLYCVKAISERHILVAGGGGQAKTGIANTCEIYELIYDKMTNTCRANLVTHFDTGNRAIMNLCIVNQSKYNFELCTGGMDGICNVYRVNLKLTGDDNGELEQHETKSQEDDNSMINQSVIKTQHTKSSLSRQNSANLGNVRLRTFSNSTTIGELEANLGNNLEPLVPNPTLSTSGVGGGPGGPGGDITNRKSSKPQINPHLKSNNLNSNESQSTNSKENSSLPYSGATTEPPISVDVCDYRFEFQQRTTFQTDFSTGFDQKKRKREPFQKLIRYSPGANLIFSGGADGVVRVWSYPDYKMLKSIEAHVDEVDDIDVHPNGVHLTSVSRSGNNSVWNLTTGGLVCRLNYSQAIPKPTNGTKLALFQSANYVCRGCRYANVEDNPNNVRLYMILNQLAQTKPPLESFLCKWYITVDGQYRIEKIVSAGDDNLSSLAISDDGRFLAVGTLTGTVDVYIAFSLQRCYHLKRAHNIFVTGLEFLPSTNPASLELTGGPMVDAAVVSISVDNHIVLHKIPKKATLGFCGSFIFFVMFMFVLYLTMNYFDL